MMEENQSNQLWSTCRGIFVTILILMWPLSSDVAALQRMREKIRPKALVEQAERGQNARAFEL